jgi:putative glycosyltransferase (TIGR04372 family)
MRMAIGRLTGLLLDQSIKTLRRPARIVAAGRYLALRILQLSLVRHLLIVVSTHPRLVPIHRFLLPRLGPRLESAVALGDFMRGAALLDQNRPLEAYMSLARCLERSTDPHHFFVGAVCLMVGLGRFNEAMSALARGNELRWQRARSLGVANQGLRFLPAIWHGAFGHMAEIDYVIKLGILEGRPREDTILYVAPGTAVANRFLLDQWRPHMRVVERAVDLPLPRAQLETLEYTLLGPRLDDGTTAARWPLAAETYRRWHAEGRRPLLTLGDETVRRGWSVLESVGVPRDAWFVALHVREAASKAQHAQLHNVLNARVEDYFPAIAEITRRGGWVIALGDPKMTPLPPLAQVLDYRHSRVRSEWMDIFLCAQARFFLGTSSGPAYVPPLYGVPGVLTNWWPHAQKPWHPTDIFLPKLYRRTPGGPFMTLAESLKEPFGYCNSTRYLSENQGVTVEDNDPEDIRLAVVEMFDRLAGRADTDMEASTLRARANEIYARNGINGMSELARDFLRRHIHFVSAGASNR